MSVWFRARPPSAETRLTPEALPQPLQALLGIFKQSYDNVDLSSAESNLQSVAVGAAVDLLASLASELPMDVFRGGGGRREEIPMSRHPWLEDPDGDGHGLADWIYRVMWSWLLRGNLHGNVLDRGPGGTLRQVELFHPDRVHPQLDNGLVRWFHEGREIPRGQVLHRRVNPVPGWVLGLSPVGYHMWTIGLNLSATRYGMQWFQDGAHPSSILRNNDHVLDKTQADTVKDRFMAALRGTREPVVLGKGWEWQKIQLAPEESQFLQTQGFTAAEACRIFGPGIAEVLGYGSGLSGGGGSLTYSNIIDRDLHLLKYALRKWLRRLERLLGEFLPAPQFVRLNRDALLETDTLSRFKAHAIALDKRFKVVNEIRDKEDLPPVAWGNEPNPTPGAAPSEPDDEDDDEGDD